MAVTDLRDVIIIGAGPAGMAAAVYTGRSRLSTLVLEKSLPGGQILLTEWVENCPGFPDGIAPFDLMEKFQRHALKFGAEILTDEAVSIRRDGSTWTIAGRKADYRGRAVIIATGSSYRKLRIPNETELTGRGVSYCAVCDGAFFRDQEAAVVGGGDNALTEALYLTKFCRQVHLIHRRDKFRAVKILQERVLANGKIVVHWDTVVESLLGTERLETLRLRNVRDGEGSELRVDGLFISIGMDPHAEFVRGLVDFNEWGQVKVNEAMSASQPGLFAAGDVAGGCPRQIATAVGTGVTAALAVDDYLSGM